MPSTHHCFPDMMACHVAVAAAVQAEEIKFKQEAKTRLVVDLALRAADQGMRGFQCPGPEGRGGARVRTEKQRCVPRSVNSKGVSGGGPGPCGQLARGLQAGLHVGAVLLLWHKAGSLQSWLRCMAA